MAQHPSFDDPNIPPGEPVPGQTYRADGWAVMDMPGWLPLYLFRKFVTIVGEDHLVVMSMSLGKDKDEGDTDFVRGTLLISPTGMARVAAAMPKVH